MKNNQEEMLISKEESKKYKKVRGICMGVASIAVLGALCMQGIEICDGNVDHVNEYCPLNSVLGVEHQIKKINAMSGYSAYLLDDEYYKGDVLYTETVNPYTYKTDEGTYFVAPEGYVLDGDMAVRTTISSDKITYVGDDAIVVTKDKEIVMVKTDNDDYTLSYEDIIPEPIKVLGRNLVLDIPVK